MGNEVSSVQIHSLLTAQDIKALRDNFPGGGNGEPPSHLDWGAWGSAWPEKERTCIEKLLKGNQAEQQITFHAYQDLAGNSVRGNSEDRVKLLFKLLNRPTDKSLKSSEMEAFVSTVMLTASNAMAPGADWAETSKTMAKSLMHELVAPGTTAKMAMKEESDEEVLLDFDMIERWLVMKCPLFEEIYVFTLAMSFGIAVTSATAGIRKPPLFPLDGLTFQSAKNGSSGSSSPACHETALTPAEVIFLNHHLPTEARTKWRCLFNSKLHGENFARMSAGMLGKGPTLIIIWEKDGYRFGGFAGASWQLGPKFFGPNNCFLFSLSPRMYNYETTSFNSNYMYMNLKQKTLPNGIGMGGQLEYFGFWLDNEYGKGKCAPTCSSYQSPQLSKSECFQYVHAEVWGVGEEPARDSDDEDGGRTALDLDQEAQAMMEMMGKTFVSKDVRAADEQNEKEKQDEEKRQRSEMS